jgi:ABC-type sugar transport system ATPase subunit
MGPIKLQTRHIRKVYPGTVALEDVSLGFEAGKVSALIGKNGAGKSTLVKIFAGAVQPTGGTLLVDGREVILRSPREALRKGIATVHQELSLIPELTIAENILLGRLPKKTALGVRVIDWPEVYRRAEEILAGIHAELDVRRNAGRLSVAQQQMVEIAKATSFTPSAVLLDEPTSALAHHEVEQLFNLIRCLAERGVAVVYITHRLQELRDIADSVSTLRDGQFIGTVPIGEATPKTIVQMMFGQTVPAHRPAPPTAARGPAVLEVRRLRVGDKVRDASFKLNQGEVLGVAGMLGSGRTEMLMAIFGATPFDEGEILVGSRLVRSPTPARMKRAGFGLAPENRKEQGLVLLLSTRDNVCLAALDRISARGIIWKARQRRVVDRTVRDLQLAVADVEQPVSTLSGGNQQKVVVGKWLNTQPRIMLFDEPTRGIDIQAKQQIFEIISGLSRQGISSIFVSSELEELLEVCHRILIMRKGRIVEEVAAQGLHLDKLFALCMED